MRSWSARLGFAAAGFAVAFVVATIGLGFLGAALFLELEAAGLSPPAAAAIVGAAGLALAALIGLLAKRFLRPAAAPTMARTGSTVNDAAADLGALVAQQIVSSARAHPYGTIGAALAAGLAVGALPELRKALKGLFKG